MHEYVFEFDKPDDGITSDYGFYGKTGICRNHGLTDIKCKCGGSSILCCEYDDTPGFKETVYMLKCDKCKNTTTETCLINNVIKKWNKQSYKEPTEKALSDQARQELLESLNDTLWDCPECMRIGIYTPVCHGCGYENLNF